MYERYYFTNDGTNLISMNDAIDQQYYGSYCLSNDSQKCYTDNYYLCDPSDLSNCATIDGINPVNVQYALTYDNYSSIFYDNASLCNFTDDQTWCNIQYDEDYNVCGTTD